MKNISLAFSILLITVLALVIIVNMNKILDLQGEVIRIENTTQPDGSRIQGEELQPAAKSDVLESQSTQSIY